MRAILVGYREQRPQDVRFTYTNYGKPLLAGATVLRFNRTAWRCWR